MSDIIDTARRVLELAEAALPGPWTTWDEPDDGEVFDEDNGKLVCRTGRHPLTANASLIAEYRTAAPDLARAVIDQAARIAKLEEALREACDRWNRPLLWLEDSQPLLVKEDVEAIARLRSLLADTGTRDPKPTALDDFLAKLGDNETDLSDVKLGPDVLAALSDDDEAGGSEPTRGDAAPLHEAATGISDRLALENARLALENARMRPIVDAVLAEADAWNEREEMERRGLRSSTRDNAVAVAANAIDTAVAEYRRRTTAKKDGSQ